MYVAIIGGKNSGKMIFVTLLYATQIKYSEETSGDFRFSSEPNAQAILGYHYNSLRLGKWPKKKLTSSVTFSFGYGMSSLGKRLRRFFNKYYEEPQISLKFGIFEIPDRNEKQIENSTPKSFITEPKRIDLLARSRICIVLLDSSNLGHDENTDVTITRVIEKIAQMNRGEVYPIIVYTKFDIVNNKNLKKLKLPLKPPNIKDDKARAEYGQRITEHYYPKLSKAMINNNPKYYFVHLKVERNSKGKLVPSIPTDLDLEIDYSYEDYNNLIEYLGTIGKIDRNSNN